MPSISKLLLTSVAAIAMVGLAPQASALAATAAGTVQMERADLNATYNNFLSKYVVNADGINLVEYGQVTAADKAKLKAYVARMQKQKPSTMDRDEELAFWFNLYNAKTIEIILENYPVESIRQIGGGFIAKGPWKADAVTVEGRVMSLDNIEHDTVRAKFDEPRVHYAFNCASLGCPNLKPSAWDAATLDADLDEAARAYIAHPRGIRVDSNGRVVASSIYNWFKKDFGRNDAAVLDHIRQYATGDKLDQLQGVKRINGYQYDWSLNEAN